MQIPDWAWKFISVLVLPVVVWAIATHVAVGQHDVRLLRVEQSQEKESEKVDEQKEMVGAMQKDMAVMKNDMQYLRQDMNEIKTILKEERKSK